MRVSDLMLAGIVERHDVPCDLAAPRTGVALSRMSETSHCPVVQGFLAMAEPTILYAEAIAQDSFTGRFSLAD